MKFKVSGIVHRTKTREPIPRLLVVAFDKDVLFDDLLGTCETGEDGRFVIEFDKSDYTDFYGRRPDIYVAVFAPPCRRLLDTSSHIRWGASEHEFFNLYIDDDVVSKRGDGDLLIGLRDITEWEVG